MGGERGYGRNMSQTSSSHRSAQLLCVLRVGLLDAVIWTWFRQLNYATPFRDALLGAATGTVVPLGLLAAAVIIGLQWDRVPRAVHAGCSVATCVATGLAALGCTVLGFAEPLRSAIGVAMILLAPFCQVVRWERLALCGSLTHLLGAMVVSLMAAYGFSYLLMVLPEAGYWLVLAAAPLSLLANGSGERWELRRGARLSVGVLRAPMCVLCAALSCAGGFIVATGGSSLASTPAAIFTEPSPLYFLMLVLYMTFGVVVANKLVLPRAAWFACLNAFWTLGSLVAAPWVPFIPASVAVPLSSVICIVLLACCLIGWTLWTPGCDAAEGRDVLARIAENAGLTPREAEVAALLIEGRSLPVIQERLSISEGTARTHAKHIYEKTGVHTKQELIDLYWDSARRSL